MNDKKTSKQLINVSRDYMNEQLDRQRNKYINGLVIVGICWLLSILVFGSFLAARNNRLQDELNILKTQIIDKGYAEYVITNQFTGASTWQWKDQ